MQEIKGRLKKWLIEWREKINITRKEKKIIKLILIISGLMSILILAWDNAPFSGVLHRNTYGEGS